MQSNWEEAHSKALRNCVEKGMSFAEAARALNERFGTAYTRNAAIGRARRMGICAPARPHSASIMNAPKKPDARRLREMRAGKLTSVPHPLPSSAPQPFSFGVSPSTPGISR